ncbi:MAG: hypothetical protein OWT27_10095 [Firmicutes bacterium]|nr:hypothetical protein [Bacillota bacterium]
MRWMAKLSAFFIVLLAIAGFWIPLFFSHEKMVEPDFLLTVLATTGALGGIAFALYGWYTSREIPRYIEESAKKNSEEMWRDLQQTFYRQQEAMQKVMASYSVQDARQKIDLLEKAIVQDPTVYNAYVALGYVYWYELGDVMKAEECFRKDLAYHPDNVQSMSDLAALFASVQEYHAAMRWIREALQHQPALWKDFDADSRLIRLRETHPKEWAELLAPAKKHTQNL